MPASAPPARITSASPRRSISAATPIACAPVAQAETTAKFGPRRLQVGGDVAGRRVDQEVRQEVRREPVRPLGQDRAPARSPSACRRRRAEHDAGAGRVDRRRCRRSPTPRARRRQRQRGDAIHLARLAPAEALLGVEALHLGGDLAGDPRRVEQRHGPRPLVPASSASHVSSIVVPTGVTRPDARDDDLMRIHARADGSVPAMLPHVASVPGRPPRAHGPSGHEEPAAGVWRALRRRVRRASAADVLGNSYARVGPDSGPAGAAAGAHRRDRADRHPRRARGRRRRRPAARAGARRRGIRRCSSGQHVEIRTRTRGASARRGRQGRRATC